MMKSAFTAIAAFLLMVSPVMAKEGFYIGAFLPTSTLSGDAGTNIDAGTGWGLRAGIGFSRYVALEANYSTTKHDIKNVPGTSSTDLKGLSGDLKLNFPLTSLDRAQVMTVEPYLLFGFGHFEVSKPSSVKSDGFQWGLGIELYLFKELSIHVGWTKSNVSFDSTPKREGDIKTVDFGLIYHFI
jgi:hypothetical protein